MALGQQITCLLRSQWRVDMHVLTIHRGFCATEPTLASHEVSSVVYICGGVVSRRACVCSRTAWQVSMGPGKRAVYQPTRYVRRQPEALLLSTVTPPMR